MRTLVLLRGVAGSGKSTFIKENNLEHYTISSDNIRLLFQPPRQGINGSWQISNDNEKRVWSFIQTLVEDRMKNGEFTIVDATHLSNDSFKKYKKLSEQYRYKILCVDFSDISLEEIKLRNMSRPKFKQVPEDVIERMYEKINNQNIPAYINIIKPNEFKMKIQVNPLDLSYYKKIHHIGDLHGCNTVLQEYLNGGLKDNEFYIFCGDFLDRGIENAELLKFLFSIYEKSNVIMLEGNHELWLWYWANDEINLIKSKEFRKFTMFELEDKISKKEARKFYRKLRQMAYYKYNEKSVIVTHGGISFLPQNLIYVSSRQLIHGVGNYSDDIDNIFFKNTNANTYQIHGHRNIFNNGIKVNEKCFNLEGKIEANGCLRIVTLNDTGFTPIEIKNNIFNKERFDKKEDTNNDVFLSKLRSNKYIGENSLGDNISSFNFKRKAFYEKIWDEQLIKARGLFINTKTKEIVSRSYNKFFNIGEMEFTQIENLKNSLVFPVKTYVKENGYLGILGYNSEFDELIFSSKSTFKNEHSQWFKELIVNKLNHGKLEELKKYIKNNNCSLVFEVISKNDPHIIEYDKDDVVLLDIIKREIMLNRADYEEIIRCSQEFNLKHKELAYTFNNWAEFKEWYDDLEKSDGRYKEKFIEGFVIEDSKGFMTKIKVNYYNYWKSMRKIKDNIIINREFESKNYNCDPFVKFLRGLTEIELQKDIITLRNMFKRNI